MASEKLTEAQYNLLLRVEGWNSLGAAIRPNDVTVAGELSLLDLVKHRWFDSENRYRLYITPAGRIAIDGAREGETR